MIEFNVSGTVLEVLFTGEKSCKFIVGNDKGSIVGTITASRIKLAEKIKQGNKFNFKGYISAYSKQRNGKVFVENTYYITDIE
ncbi:MAG TPA: hypothetical protein DGK91_05585 [Clostridium sp.]|jgi:hypothetical protein|nr:hypothetical protein [Clostridium sp.]